MDKNKELTLPKTYQDKNGKYPQHEGKPKGSYSQYSSFLDPEYNLDYYRQYFLRKEIPSGEFAQFGSEVGELIETQGDVKGEALSMQDVGIVMENVDFPPNCVYEDHVVVDFGNFVVEGYIDRCEYLEDGKVRLKDFKTGNADVKDKYYASEDYGQTTLYSYQKEQEGSSIDYSGVTLLGRKGNKIGGDGNWKMRLSGVIKEIPTPYSKERAKKLLSKMRETFEQISEEYKIYKKLFE